MRRTAGRDRNGGFPLTATELRAPAAPSEVVYHWKKTITPAGRVKETVLVDVVSAMEREGWKIDLDAHRRSRAALSPEADARQDDPAADLIYELT